MEPLTAQPASPRAVTAACATGLMLACVLLRCLASTEVFPAWSNDPYLLPAPTVALGPSAVLALDAIQAAAGLIACLAAGVVPSVVLSLLVTAGIAVAWMHAQTSIDHLLLGSAWSSAMIVGLAACTLSAKPELKRLMVGVALAAVIAMACKGVVQVYVDHQQTLASFKHDKAKILEAHGWAADSVQAKSFERRIEQPEAVAWFGLANITATFAAGAFVMLATLAVRARGRGGKIVTILTAGALASGVLVVLAGSKGGFAATAIMLVVASIAAWASRDRVPRWASWVGIVLIAMVIAGLVARGLVGERLGEKSLLFRWFYAVGSARIIVEHWLFGVGPAAFKDAYLLAKLPIATEDVTSPHDLLLDFPATLGLGGVAWCLVWLTWVKRAGPGLVAPASDLTQSSISTGLLVRLAVLVITLATVFAVRVEGAITTPEAATARIAALVLGASIAGAVLVLGAKADHLLTRSAAAGGLAIAMLGLIDLAPVGIGSAPLFMLFVAFASVPAPTTVTWPRQAGVLAAWVAAIALAAARWPSVYRWESLLESAAEPLREAGTIQTRLDALTTPNPDDSLQRVLADLSALVKHPVPPDTPSVRGALLDARTIASRQAFAKLGQAAKLEPAHAPTLEAATGQGLILARVLPAQSPEATAARQQAIAFAEQELATPIGKSPALAWRAGIAASEEGPPGLARAIDLMRQASALDPYNPQSQLRLADFLRQAGRPTEAAEAARQALALDAKRSLDPLIQFDPATRARLQAIVDAGSRGQP